MNRTEIAAMCLQGILSNQNVLPDGHQDYYVPHAVRFADALLAELAKTEPKVEPKQRPWKVGDFVTITHRGTHKFKIGQRVTLNSKREDGGWWATSNGDLWVIKESEAELITD